MKQKLLFSYFQVIVIKVFPNILKKFMSKLILPKKFEKNSKIRIIFPSSALNAYEESRFKKYVDYFYQKFPKRVKILRKSRNHPVIKYLAAPLEERKKFFLEAVKTSQFIIPGLGGTGLSDLIDSFTERELNLIIRKRPILCGFSDFSGLCNFLYFKKRFLSFCYVNAWNFFRTDKYNSFFYIIKGQNSILEYTSKYFHWLENKPNKVIYGKAIGGTFSTIVHVLDRPEKLVKNWNQYILFLEDVEADLEDLHLLINSFKRKGVFKQIKALVLGELSYTPIPGHLRDFPKKFAQKEKFINKVFIHLIKDELEKRDKMKQPLPILKINNFGHEILKNNLILPIGAKTIITPNKKIVFEGPFVK